MHSDCRRNGPKEETEVGEVRNHLQRILVEKSRGRGRRYDGTRGVGVRGTSAGCFCQRGTRRNGPKEETAEVGEARNHLLNSVSLDLSLFYCKLERLS